MGIPDAVWGERVAAALVVNEGASLDIDSLREWVKERLATYEIPQGALLMEELPKNAMGKVSRSALEALMEGKNV